LNNVHLKKDTFDIVNKHKFKHKQKSIYQIYLNSTIQYSLHINTSI